MELIIVRYLCKKGMRDAYLAKVYEENIHLSSQNEEGNICYDFFKPVEKENEVLLLEKWTDAEAVKTHGTMSHYKRLGEIKAEFVDETIIERYQI